MRSPSRSRRRLTLASVALLAVAPALARAQEAGPIKDNSFLVEEAYNQEPRVVQHISALVRNPATGGWAYAFTQEWPLGGERWQGSYTAMVNNANGGGRTGFGDGLLNLRYQVPMAARSRFAMAPRLSAVLPTGRYSDGHGRGGYGAQVNVPLSIEWGRALVSHTNVGGTVTYHARDAAGHRATLVDLAAGQSVIWLLTDDTNLMLEGLWSRTAGVTGAGTSASANSFLLSPGIRQGINVGRSLQIVPGVAVPFELVAAPRRASLFAYLSFEHGF